MINTKLKQLILKVLKDDDRLWCDEELNQTLLIDLVEKTDANIIDLLLQNETLRENFFVKIPTPSQSDTPPEGNTYVFKTRDFVFFLEENKVDNSYTQYKNRIGLTDGKRFLKDTTDVVLDFPYKDCVLEGGQSNEDGTDTYVEYDETVTKTQEKKGLKAETYNRKQAKRKEIFFNSVLAQDEIDRLFDKKALINWKKFDKDGEYSFCHSELDSESTIQRDENGTIKDNLVIKGNNLLALHSLKSEFAGKVKLIYIDPPYNTGNDGFKYNDNFNHSTWLTFMKNRLEVAKTLLRDDGVIFVQCDDNEQAYLKVLMDEMDNLNFINCIVVKMNESKGLKNAHIEKKLPKSKEYIIAYSKRNFLFRPQKIEKDKEELSGYVKYYNKQIINLENDISLWKMENFVGSIEDRILNAKKLIYLVKPDNNIKIDLKENTFGRIVNNRGIENYYFNNGRNILKVLFLYQNLHKHIGDLWLDISTININKEGGMRVFSNGQKPEKLLERIIEISTQPNDIVLDYHLGSGTTCAVAHKMGRQYIGIEQMDYIEDIAVERLKKVIDGEQGGISKSVNWQGGGDFLYCELAEWNEKAKAEILEQKDFASLKSFFEELYEKYFLNYNLKTKEFVEKTIQEENFAKLTLDEQKAIFIAMLDNNQMYVNQSEIDDEKYGVSESDKVMSGEFYNLKEK